MFDRKLMNGEKTGKREIEVVISYENDETTDENIQDEIKRLLRQLQKIAGSKIDYVVTIKDFSDGSFKIIKSR